MTTIKNYTQKKKKNYSQNNNNVGCVVLLLKKKKEKKGCVYSCWQKSIEFWDGAMRMHVLLYMHMVAVTSTQLTKEPTSESL